MMSHRAYAWSLVASTLALAAALAAASASLEPLSGDLARIGRYEESEFGWRAPQARFSAPLFDVEPQRAGHDVVILGDSFSLDVAAGWPNHFVALTGARVAGYHIARTEWRFLLNDPAFRASPPKVFVLQVVERDALKWLGAESSEACGVSVPAPRVRFPVRPRSDGPVLVERRTRRHLVELDPHEYVQTLWARLARRLGRRVGETVETPLIRPVFSSRRDDTLLVYAGDLLKAHWSQSDIRAVNCGLARISDAVQRDGLTLFLALLIPDKLSAYSPYLADRSLADLGALDRLDLRGISHAPIAPALDSLIRAGVRDVYLPDDTHLGHAGQRAVALALADELRARRALIRAEVVQRPSTTN